MEKARKRRLCQWLRMLRTEESRDFSQFHKLDVYGLCIHTSSILLCMRDLILYIPHIYFLEVIFSLLFVIFGMLASYILTSVFQLQCRYHQYS